MSTPLLTTKLYMPPPRPKLVARPRLHRRLDASLHHKLTLISAPAGFGKTTLLSTWLAERAQPAAWLSLDKEENDPAHFLRYLIAALQTVVPELGARALASLQSPQPPSTAILTTILNEIAALPERLLLILDDYHMLDAPPIDQALTFLVDHLPAQLHLVIATRADPPLPLARLRARAQLTELRAEDLRFTAAESADFLQDVMGLSLSPTEIAALENRTEGWIAGLQLAALSLQGQADSHTFLQSFTGSHHFVLDYLISEVLHQQPEEIQSFLLYTSILNRLCGPLCDALLGDHPALANRPSHALLAALERANLFIIPLDNERHWYRYHHLFADLLRQRLQQRLATSPPAGGIAPYHQRASRWFAANGLVLEAFQHAVAAQDVDLAAHLAEGQGMPLHFRGAATPVLQWLQTLPSVVLDQRPGLWVIYASALLFVGQIPRVAEKIQRAEAALTNQASSGANAQERDLLGHLAAIRATMAVALHDVAAIVANSRQALAYLHPDNLPVRTATTWALGHAYELQDERAAARRAYHEAQQTSAAIGHLIINLMASLGLGRLQMLDNQLELAAETYHQVLRLAGDPPAPVACEAYGGLARIHAEWNELETAARYGQQAVQLAHQLENTDRVVACENVLARLRLAQGDFSAALALITNAERVANQQQFVHQLADLAATRVQILLGQGHSASNLAAAAKLAQTYALPLSQARVALAQQDPGTALAYLHPWQQKAMAKGWADEHLKTLIVQALAYQMKGEQEQAVARLGDALALAAPSRFIRSFVDEGPALRQLLADAVARGILPAYGEKLLAAFPAASQSTPDARTPIRAPIPPPLIEPLSPREEEILHLIAAGLSNQAIGERLSLALDTIKGHNRRLFEKLQVQRRTEAVARARELGLL